MLRRSKRTQTTPVAQAFNSREAAQLVRGGVALSARDIIVPLGRGHDVEALLRQGTQNNWMPELDAISVPSEEEMQGLVAEQIGKMNGRTSPGFDCVATPFIKYAAVVRPQVNGRRTERVNVLVPYIARVFKLLYNKACIPDCWRKAKLTPLYKKGPLIELQ
eukprot:28687-Pelagomonas_calceolata.AAC.1